MARKVATPAPEPGANDLEILHPERTDSIAGLQVTVREYGFIEGLGLRPIVQPLLDDLQALLLLGEPTEDGIMVMLGRHHLLVQQLVAQAADVDPVWVAALNQSDGHKLLMMWWGANGPFYVRSAVLRIMSDKEQAKVRAGRTSTPPSPPPATETPPPSAE